MITIDNSIKQKIWDSVSKSQNIAISGHMRPDGDCIGACLSMCIYINKVFPGKNVKVFLEPVGDLFMFLNGAHDIISTYDGFTPDLFISLDCSDKGRLGDGIVLFEKAGYKINIDHHVTNTSFGDINCFDGDRSSTCELLCEIYDKDFIDHDMAECLYTGIVHDTGVFKYSCTGPKTLEAAAFLIGKDINFTEIIDKSFYEKTYTQNRILGRCLEESRLMANGRFIMTDATEEIMNEYNALSLDLEGIASALLLTKGAECSLLVHHMGNDEYKISLRSKEYLDVSRIASLFGGGGHVRAAGATLKGDYNTEIGKLIKAVEDALE